jgi:hypothetical protein
MKFTVGNTTKSFSIESIRIRYADKSVFVSDMLAVHRDFAKGEEGETELKKIMDKAWETAFPDEAKAKREKVKKEKETLPVTETNREAPE